ncbi:MAG: MATE family efflux transporter [Defluviitaleaceae bacterium]|nr:MATE family efflux transporter [Defluviitaleaceae bacterium]
MNTEKIETLETSTTEDATLNKPVNLGFLLKFALPTIVSTLLQSTFGIIDGVFVSRIIDEYALSATSLVWPFLMFVLALGFMFGIGGNALVAKELGEGKLVRARQNFSMIVVVSFAVTAVLSLFGLLLPEVVLGILGVSPEVFDIALEYLTPLTWFLPSITLGVIFQQFLITEGKAHLGMIATIIGGSLNMALNWLLIYYFALGLHGAALATSIGYTVPAIFGLFYFIYNRKRVGGMIYFVMPKFRITALATSAVNGLSEMIAMMAGSITGAFMNNILMELEGPMAVAAGGIMFAGMGIITSIFFGYIWGIGPIISYNYGKGDSERLKKLFKISLATVSVMAVAAIGGSFAFTDLFISIYITEPQVYFDGVWFTLPIVEMAHSGLRIISLGYIFAAINAFGSALFTALNNGKISGLLAALRTFGFVMLSLAVLPLVFGVDGVWFAMPAAEVLAIFTTVFFVWWYRKVYNYA